MKNIAEIINEVKVFYRNIDISSVVPVVSYAQFITEVINSDERHNSALALHTGSIFYKVMTVVVAAITCLSDKGTDVLELIESLCEGDLLLIDGKRSKFLGLKSGKEIGIPYNKNYFIYENSGTTFYTPIEELRNKSIDLYNGNAVTLDGRGIKTNLQSRKKILSFIFGQSETSQISTLISRSVAIIADKEIAEDIYHNTKIKYAQTTVKLDELVTATYFTDNDDYQMGSNISKEDPVIKFFSKVSVCRDAIISDKAKRFIGCLACDENIWVNNSEIYDIADRKSLKFSLFIGKVHYTYYEKWLNKEDYKFYIPVPEIVQAVSLGKDSSPALIGFNREINAFLERKIQCEQIDSICLCESMVEIKRKLLIIKNQLPESREKDEFLINSYFILNLCRSSFFPLKYYDTVANSKLYTLISLTERFKPVSCFNELCFGECKEYAQFIFIQLKNIVEQLYDNNPKGKHILSSVGKKQIDCIVATKAYYETIFLYWVKAENLYLPMPKILTVSEYEKSEKIFSNVVFVTGYYDFYFNPNADFGFRRAELLYYDFEILQIRKLRNSCNQGKALIHKHNYCRYDFVAETNENTVQIDNEIDERYESDLEKLSKDLQMKRAYGYARSNSGGDTEASAEIKMIISFASGSVGYFTKQYKAYRLSADSASETDLENLRVGDSLIFTKESENKDIVDVILQELLTTQYKNTEYPLLYKKSLIWKDKIREYMTLHNLTYQAFAERLHIFGCIRHQVTIRSWLYEETHIVGPRDEEDYAAIFKAIGFNDLASAEVKYACDEIRSLRVKILGLLGKAIVSNVTSKHKDPLWSEILGNAERLSQTEQIISIETVTDGMRLPINLVNKPCTI